MKDICGIISQCLEELAQRRTAALLEEGYKAMAKENKDFAKMAYDKIVSDIVESDSAEDKIVSDLVKRDEIRDWLSKLLCPKFHNDCGLCSYRINDNGFDLTLNNPKCLHPDVDANLIDLDSMDVVIKTDRELPRLMPEAPNNEYSSGYCAGERNIVEILVAAGYVATERLIKETDDITD